MKARRPVKSHHRDPGERRRGLGPGGGGVGETISVRGGRR